MMIGRLVCAYPDGLSKPMSKWTIVSDLEVSHFVTAKDLIQKNPQLPVRVTKRPASTYAVIRHIGPYAKEGPTIKRLHEYMKANHLKIIGPHEEVYLTRPGPKAKTIIRYAVQKR